MTAQRATLYRMVTDEHICPFGIKAKDLLERRGFDVNDHPLKSRAEADAFKKKYDVGTTPQVFIDSQRVGGYDALRARFGLDSAADDDDGTTYQPIIALFGMTALMAIAAGWGAFGRAWPSLLVLRWFVAFSMCALALQKLRDLESFSNQFITYDILGMRVVRYAYIYPFVEGLAGIGMIADVLWWVVAPAALVIGSIGAVSIVKAVYIDKRELRCACVGGNSNVPLGFISLSENIIMVAMAIWMIVRAVG